MESWGICVLHVDSVPGRDNVNGRTCARKFRTIDYILWRPSPLRSAHTLTRRRLQIRTHVGHEEKVTEAPCVIVCCSTFVPRGSCSGGCSDRRFRNFLTNTPASLFLSLLLNGMVFEVTAPRSRQTCHDSRLCASSFWAATTFARSFRQGK